MTTATMPGAEPYSAPGGPCGALLLHGFTGTPASMRRTAERIASKGLAVEAPLLPGHGTSAEDLERTGWGDWSGAAERAYTDLASRCDRVAVAGHSMGGTLACWLAERHPEVPGVAVVNPLVQPYDDQLRGAARDLLEDGTAMWPSEGPDVADPSVTLPGYDATPLAAFLSLCEGVGEVAAALDRISCPVLVLSSRADHVVPPANGDALVAAVSGSCTRVWLERSYHSAMADYDHEEVEARIAEFVVSVTGRPEREDT